MVYVGNLDARISEQELEDDFQTYGVIKRIWVARKPPGYVFIDFDDHIDTQNETHDLDGKHNWRVELPIALQVVVTGVIVIAEEVILT